MKRYKLIKWDNGYEPLEINGVYDGTFVPKGWMRNIEETVKRFPDEWEDMSDVVYFVDSTLDKPIRSATTSQFDYKIILSKGQSLSVLMPDGSTITITA